MKSILIIMAMEDEASPLVNSLELKNENRLHNIYSIKKFSGKYKDLNINLITNGTCSRYNVDSIGTQVSTLSAHLGIENFSPNLILNAGTAGGFHKDNAKIGDVYLSSPYVCYHDRRIELPKFDKYGIGFYPCFPAEDMAMELGLRLGVVSTGNSLDYTEKDLALMISYNGVVKDMEAAAIAWVAEQHQIPFLAIKAITDIVDGDKPTEKEFVQNLKFASGVLSEKTIKIIDYLSANSF